MLFTCFKTFSCFIKLFGLWAARMSINTCTCNTPRRSLRTYRHGLRLDGLQLHDRVDAVCPTEHHHQRLATLSLPSMTTRHAYDDDDDDESNEQDDCDDDHRHDTFQPRFAGARRLRLHRRADDITPGRRTVTRPTVTVVLTVRCPVAVALSAALYRTSPILYTSPC